MLRKITDKTELSHLDMVEAVVEGVREAKTKEDAMTFLIEVYGGGNLYIPSHKTTTRNEKLLGDFNNGVKIKTLMRRYDLSEARVRAILKEKRQPRLF